MTAYAVIATRFEWMNLRPVHVRGACGLWKGRVWTQASSMSTSHFVSTPPRSSNHLLHSCCHHGQDLCCVPTFSHELPYSLETSLCNNSHQFKTRTHRTEWILLAKPLLSCCYTDKGEHTLEFNLTLVCNSILFYTSGKHTRARARAHTHAHTHLHTHSHSKPFMFNTSLFLLIPSVSQALAAAPLALSHLLTHPIWG